MTNHKFKIINNKLLLLLVLAAVVLSCRPRGILSSRQMREVIVDLHKIDGMIQVAGLQYGHDEAENLYYAQVLEQHGVTQAQFDSSLVWYTAHPQLFDKIYPKVIAQLEREREDFMAAHNDQLNLQPDIQNEQTSRKREALTSEQLDSLLWVIQNGYPSMWQPLPKPFKGPLNSKL